MIDTIKFEINLYYMTRLAPREEFDPFRTYRPFVYLGPKTLRTNMRLLSCNAIDEVTHFIIDSIDRMPCILKYLN